MIFNKMKTAIHGYECPWCMSLIETGTELCPVCGENQNIAVLTCSHQIGTAPAGISWRLYPRDYTVGSGPDADILVKGDDVPEEVLVLRYIGGYYHVGKFPAEKMSKTGKDKQERSFIFRIGNGALTLKYVGSVRYSDYRRVAPQALEIVFSATCQILNIDDMELVHEKALDTVLRITGLEKAYFFKVHGMGLTMESARDACMSNLNRNFCGFCETPIRNSVTEKDILCYDFDRDADTRMTKSMTVLGLRKILCIPVTDKSGRISAIIYADTQKTDFLSPELALFRPALRMLAKIIAFKTGILQAGERRDEN